MENLFAALVCFGPILLFFGIFAYANLKAKPAPAPAPQPLVNYQDLTDDQLVTLMAANDVEAYDMLAYRQRIRKEEET